MKIQQCKIVFLRLDATIISGESTDGQIYAVFDHTEDEKELCIFKEPIKLDGYEDGLIKFWRIDNLNSLNVEMRKETLEDLII